MYTHSTIPSPSPDLTDPRLLRCAFAAAAALALAPTGALGAGETTWSGAKDDWMDGTKWDNGVPDPNDRAVVPSGISRIKLADGAAPAACSSLRVGGAGAGGACHLQAGALKASSMIMLGDAGGDTGTFVLKGGTLNTSTTFVGGAGTGAFTQTGGTHGTAVKPITWITIGKSSNADGTYTLDGGDVHAKFLQVGLKNGGGTALLSQAGGTVTTAFLEVGVGATGTGKVKLSKGIVKTTTRCIIGSAGTGSFDLSGTGTLEANLDPRFPTSPLTIGLEKDASGSMKISGGTLKAATMGANSPALRVGAGGMGLLEVSGGESHKLHGWAQVAELPGSEGTITLVGGLLDITKDLKLGSIGMGGAAPGKARLTADGNGGTGTLRLRVQGTLSMVDGGDAEITFRNKAKIEVGSNDFPKGKVKGDARFEKFELFGAVSATPFVAGGPELLLEPSGDESPHGTLHFEGDGVLDGGVIAIDIDGDEPGATLDQVVFADMLSAYGTVIEVTFGPSIDLAALPAGAIFPIIGAAGFDGWFECALPPTGNPATELVLVDVAVPTDDGLELWKAVEVASVE